MADNRFSIVVDAKTGAAQAELKKLGDQAASSFDRARVAAAKFETSLSNTWRGMKGAWVEIAAGAVALNTAWNLANSAAKFQEREQAFANLAASHGQNARKILDDLRAMSAGTVDTMTLMEKAGSAMTLGIPAEKLAKLMEIARATAKVTGQDVTTAFQDIVTAVGRGSQMILDNLGIIVKVGEANEAYAATLGKTADKLTDAEKKQAFMNATLEAGEDVIERVGQKTASQAEMFQRYQARWRDVMVEVGKVVLTIARGMDFVFGMAAAGIAKITEKGAAGLAWYYEMWDKVPGIDVTKKAQELRSLQWEAKTASDWGITYMNDAWEDMTGTWKEAEPVVTKITARVEEHGTEAKKSAGKVKDLAAESIRAAQGVYGLWEAQAKERYEVSSRSLDAMIEKEAALKEEGVAAAEGVTDFWQMQHAERFEVHSRALEALVQKEEEAGNLLADLSQRTADAMEDNFSDLFFDAMEGKFDSLEDYAKAVFESIARAAADYAGQLARQAVFGEGGGGGLLETAIGWVASAASAYAGGGGGAAHIGAGEGRAGHAGTALSAALGMAAARDMNGGSEHVVAVAGDAAFTCGVSYEALNNVAETTRKFIVVLNDNEWSIARNTGAIAEHLKIGRAHV
jgi:PAS domain-containing protein